MAIIQTENSANLLRRGEIVFGLSDLTLGRLTKQFIKVSWQTLMGIILQMSEYTAADILMHFKLTEFDKRPGAVKTIPPR